MTTTTTGTTMTTTTPPPTMMMTRIFLLLSCTMVVSGFTMSPLSQRQQRPVRLQRAQQGPLGFLGMVSQSKDTTTVASSSSSTSTTTTTAHGEMSPEYLAARMKAEQVLTSQLMSSDSKTDRDDDDDDDATAPPNSGMLGLLLHFVSEYLGANQRAFEATGDAELNGAEASVTRILRGIQLGVTYGLGEDRYTFGSSHKALRGGEEGNDYGDFYAFGCDFFRPCMDLAASKILGMDNLRRAASQLDAGENVVFFANHQSEADPQVMSCLLETVGLSKQAERLVYVAGHKVTTDPLAIPFSMGRNLICIHSKKHLQSDPETKPLKQRQNLEAMSSMLGQLREGGCSIWVAPSGGRDRRDLSTGDVPLAPFDSKTIDMFRLMGNKSKRPTHYYSLAMASYDLCPPPDFVDAGVGEQRNVRFVPVGIAVGTELKSIGGLEGRHEFCDAAYEQCQSNYDLLLKEMKTAE